MHTDTTATGPAETSRIELGEVGVWLRATALDAGITRAIEAAGYGTLWIGGSPEPDLALVETALDESERLAVATGIVPIWAAPPEVLAASWHRIQAHHPDRFLLGIGTSHPERWGAEAASPYDTLVAYLDGLEAAGVPAQRLVLAALGPRTLRLAAERTAGAHPFLVPTSHTHAARERIGPRALLAPEQRVVLEADPERARAMARPTVQTPYLGLCNYREHLRRLGWSEADLDDGGSDALIDALVVSGDDAAVAAGIRAQLAAGADHVAVQLLDADEAGYARVAAALGLTGDRPAPPRPSA